MAYRNPTQNERIIAYINEFGSITPLEAMRDLGVMRLASRITDLKNRDYPITSEWVSAKNRWGKKCRFKRYSLKKEESEHECQSEDAP